MIGFFTDPYPDELLYSACARYHHRTGYLSNAATVSDLFGHDRSRMAVDFPTRLNFLASQLPSATYSVDNLIDDHTMLPLYSPFMPPERHRALRCDMGGRGGGSVHARLGVLTSATALRHLRFCIMCIERDREIYGETYWHRIHQIPGLEICGEHLVFLFGSQVRMYDRRNKQSFITASQATAELTIANSPATYVNPDNREQKVLLNLAMDAAWILSTHPEIYDLKALRMRYLRLLVENDLATFTGKIKQNVLRERFVEHFSSVLLERLGCGLLVKNNWLRSVVRVENRARNPLHHMLLIQFLGCSAEDFFRLPAEVEPFGKGPWPCLNPVSGHYGQTLISKCHLHYSRTGRFRKLFGVFGCGCGFCYRRKGPDARDRRFEYDQVVCFGELWYRKLSDAIAVGDHDLPQLARTFRVLPSTLAVEISRVKKANNLEGLVRNRFRGERIGRPRKTRGMTESYLRSVYRTRFKELALEKPHAGRSALRKIDNEAYMWLLKHDKSWLDQNFPRLRCPGPGIRIDWSERDQRFSCAAQETAAKMINVSGRPIRASKTAIARELNILAVVTKHANKLPLTVRVLSEVSESEQDFALRRIRWAADCYRQELVPASSWKILQRAGISNAGMARNPLVIAFIKEYASELRNINECGWESSTSSSTQILPFVRV
jgi:Tn7-like transposition protein D/TniQ